MSEPRDNLARLRAALEAGRPLPEDVGAWLLAGIDRWERRQVHHLERALYLVAAGNGHPSTERARENRNGCLTAAVEHLGWPPPSSTAEKARRLLPHVKRFEAQLWHRWKSLDAPPDRATRLERELWRAKRFATAGGLSLPQTRKQIQRIIGGGT